MSSYQTKIENLLPKLSYKLQVQFAYNCAKDVSHLDSSTEGAKCLELVAKWLNDESSVSNQELNDAASASASAAAASAAAASAASANDAINAAAYAASAYATYASAYAAAYAASASAASAYAYAYATSAAYAASANDAAAYAAYAASATTKESKFEEYYLMLLALVKGLSTLELLINNIDLKELGI